MYNGYWVEKLLTPNTNVNKFGWHRRRNADPMSEQSIFSIVLPLCLCLAMNTCWDKVMFLCAQHISISSVSIMEKEVGKNLLLSTCMFWFCVCFFAFRFGLARSQRKHFVHYIIDSNLPVDVVTINVIQTILASEMMRNGCIIHCVPIKIIVDGCFWARLKRCAKKQIWSFLCTHDSDWVRLSSIRFQHMFFTSPLNCSSEMKPKDKRNWRDTNEMCLR